MEDAVSFVTSIALILWITVMSVVGLAVVAFLLDGLYKTWKEGETDGRIS